MSSIKNHIKANRSPIFMVFMQPVQSCMKTIFDDIIFSLQKAGGASELYAKIYQYMSGDITHYFYKNAYNNIHFAKASNHTYIELPSSFLLFKRYFNLRINIKEPFIFHSTCYRICKNPNAINITTVHDFMYEIYRHDIKANLHKIQKKKAVYASDGVICISENTKKDFHRYYPKYKKPIIVAYNGYDDQTYIFKQLSRKKQIVYTGRRSGYKCFSLAVLIAKELKSYRLIIIGGGDLTKEESDMLSGVEYEKYGYMSSEDLCEIYNTSFLFLYTSEYEGFGITPIEAQACGCLVACQMTSSITEVVRNTAIPILPKNILETVSTIKRYEDPIKYTEMQKRGLENSKRFSWKKTAEEYIRFYQTVAHLRNNNHGLT